MKAAPLFYLYAEMKAFLTGKGQGNNIIAYER